MRLGRFVRFTLPFTYRTIGDKRKGILILILVLHIHNDIDGREERRIHRDCGGLEGCLCYYRLLIYLILAGEMGYKTCCHDILPSSSKNES
jgi:hypothetical protein